MCIQSLLIAVLIVCSTNGFLELFRSWPVASDKNLSLKYGKLEVSRRNNYWRGNPIFEYWSHTLFVDLQNCLWAWSLFLVDQQSYAMVFLLAAF